MTEEHDSKSSVKIVDRRRFGMDGAEKGEESSGQEDVRSSCPSDSEAAGAAEVDSAIASDSQRAEPVGGPYESEKTEVNFSSFVISLATQALMQLGQISPPPGVEMPIDRTAAKQTIDILSMIEQKTKGNLDEDESRLLEEILHNLRLGYVKSV